MSEVRRYIGSAILAATLSGSGSITAQEPLRPMLGVVEDTAHREYPGCDAFTMVDAASLQTVFNGQFSVSHGRADAKPASVGPDGGEYSAILGRMNSQNQLLTVLAVANDRMTGVSVKEYIMRITDRVPYAGAVAVLKAAGESGGVYVAATIAAEAYMQHIPGKPVLDNPRMETGYQVSVYTELIDGETQEHSLSTVRPEAVVNMGSLLVSRMIYDEASSEIIALAYDKSCSNQAACQDKPYFVRYKVVYDERGYSLTEIQRDRIVVDDDPYTQVADERVGALVQIDYQTFAFTNGLPRIILIDRDTGSQTSVTVNLEEEIRSLAVDPHTGFILIVCDAVVYTARLDSGKIEVIDSVVNPSSSPSTETGGTAEVIFSNGVAFVPTSDGDDDVRRLKIDSTGRIISNEPFAVCVDDTEANIIASIFSFDGKPVFSRPTSTATSTATETQVPTSTATSTATETQVPTSTATRYPSATSRIIEETPTRPKPTLITPTRTQRPYSNPVYIPLLAQRGRQVRR